MFYFPNTRKPDFRTTKRLDYDEYWRTRGFAVLAKLKEREVIMLEQIPAGSSVLIVGCGNSRLPLDLRDKGCVVEVGDLSEAVLAGLLKEGIKGVKFDLNAPKTFTNIKSYDYIILSEVLEHIPLPEEALDVLKYHAKHLFISLPNSAFYRYRLHLMFVGRFFTQWVHHPAEHLRFWSHADFLDWLGAQDLIVEKFWSSNGPFLKNAWPNMFGHQMVYLCKSR